MSEQKQHEYHLPFDSIEDLINKANILKEANNLQSSLTKHFLVSNNIRFKELSNGAFSIDLGGVSKETWKKIINRSTDIIDEAFKVTGVVKLNNE